MKLMRFFLITLTILSTNSYANQAATDQVKFANAWVKKPMPGMHMTAGFVEIENVTDSSLRLVAVRTSFSAHSELHSMIMVDNVMQMRKVADGWLIAPGAILTLSPGGKHAMLMGVKPELQSQSQVLLEFNIERLGWIQVPAIMKIK